LHIPERNLELAKYIPCKQAASKNLVMINKWQQLIIRSDVASKSWKCRG